MASPTGFAAPWISRRGAASAAVLAWFLTLGTVLLPAVPAAAASHAVMIHNYAYSPASLSIAQGDTVTWTNMDTAEHDVVVTSGPASFRSPMLGKGDSWSYTFTTAGSYGYTCSVHPDMRGTVSAKAAAPPPSPKAPPPDPAQQQPVAPTAAPTTAPQRTASAAATPSTPTAPSTKGTNGGEAAATPAPPPATAVAAAPEQPAASLSPLLLVAGASVAVVVFCLLLMASRPQPVAPPTEPESTPRT